MKTYILVRSAVPLGNAMVAVAHAAVACTLAYRETEEVGAWLAGPFRKVVCRVSDAEFERARAHPDHVVITESALGGAEVALAFKPRAEWGRFFTHLPLYR